jgi:hypothetical protein
MDPKSYGMMEQDLDLDLFFSEPPRPPKSCSLGYGCGQSALETIVIFGCKKLYNKEPAELSKEELQYLKSYLISLGWDADYVPVHNKKLVLDYNPDGTRFLKYIPFTWWQITFKSI